MSKCVRACSTLAVPVSSTFDQIEYPACEERIRDQPQLPKVEHGTWNMDMELGFFHVRCSTLDSVCRVKFRVSR